MECEVCGRSVERPIKVMIEGTQMQTCSFCAKFGKRVVATQRSKIGLKPKRRSTYKIVDIGREVIQDYNMVIRKARESMGLTQEELGKKISEKASVINRLESGHMVPNEKLARKLERALTISLFGDIHNEKVEHTAVSREEPTLGDMVKKKK
ncbi:MAG: multiprotein bridging factor aMBF1 [Candidatus Hydrothermarchaeales archaeon]